MDPQSLLDDHPEIGAPDRWHAAKLLPHPGILLSVMISAAAIAGASQATGSDRQAVPNHRFGSCSPSSGACATIAQRSPGLDEAEGYLADLPSIDNAASLPHEPTAAGVGDASRFNLVQQI